MDIWNHLNFKKSDFLGPKGEGGVHGRGPTLASVHGDQALAAGPGPGAAAPGAGGHSAAQARGYVVPPTGGAPPFPDGRRLGDGGPRGGGKGGNRWRPRPPGVDGDDGTEGREAMWVDEDGRRSRSGKGRGRGREDGVGGAAREVRRRGGKPGLGRRRGRIHPRFPIWRKRNREREEGGK